MNGSPVFLLASFLLVHHGVHPVLVFAVKAAPGLAGLAPALWARARWPMSYGLAPQVAELATAVAVLAGLLSAVVAGTRPGVVLVGGLAMLTHLALCVSRGRAIAVLSVIFFSPHGAGRRPWADRAACRGEGMRVP
jgi:hypothetical protein